MGDTKFGAAEGGRLHNLGQQSGVTLLGLGVRNLCQRVTGRGGGSLGRRRGVVMCC